MTCFCSHADSTEPATGAALTGRIRAIEQADRGNAPVISSDGTTEDADSYPSLLATYEGVCAWMCNSPRKFTVYR